MKKFNSTYSNNSTSEPITLASLEKIWKEEEIIPYRFKPTGEIVHLTPELSNFIEEEKKNGIFRKARSKYRNR